MIVLSTHLRREPAAQPAHQPTRMRRMFARAGLEKEEVAILRGMLSAFETEPWKGTKD